MTDITLQKRRVLSGMRPTGRLHLGNYMGALYNWVRLQADYQCFFFIADLHALTTDYANPGDVKEKSFQVALDFLAAGLDPEQCVMFKQSNVPAHSELNLLFGMFTPLGWLERVPTYKDQQEQLREKELNTFGFLGYPLLQSADILLYKPDFVPVGQDQVAHVELTREVARRFNQLYSSARTPEVEAARSDKELMKAEVSENVLEVELLPEPRVLLTPSPKLPGLDGRKMSKSYGNTIGLTDSAEEVRKKLRPMVTDPARVRRTDPGDPDVCPWATCIKCFLRRRRSRRSIKAAGVRASGALSARAGARIRFCARSSRLPIGGVGSSSGRRWCARFWQRVRQRRGSEPTRRWWRSGPQLGCRQS